MKYRKVSLLLIGLVIIVLFTLSESIALSVNWTDPTPNSGTQNTHIIVNISSNSRNEGYNFFVRDNSLKGWWGFDNNSDRLQSVNNGWGDSFSVSGSSIGYRQTNVGEGVYLDNNTYINLHPLVGNNDKGITLAWSMNITNTSFFDSAKDWIMTPDYVSGGFVMRFWYGNSSDYRIFLLLYNSTKQTITPSLYVPKSSINEFKRYALSMDFENREFNLYSDGKLVDSATTSATYNYYEGIGDELRFIGKSGMAGVLIDDIMFFNVSLTENEAKLVSNYSNISTLVMDYTEDKNITIKPYAYENSTVATNQERNFSFLRSTLITYTHIFNNNNLTLWAYCRGVLDGVTETVTHHLEYTLNNETWIELNESYQDNGLITYAVIGDSMSNSYSDWPGYFTEKMGIPDAKVPTYAIAGAGCGGIYNQLIQNVSNNTDYLFVTCGVNGVIPTSNTGYWEDIYNEAKEKNISNIYMTTMPPWDAINEYTLATAETLCERQKSQNEWLMDFANNHSDLEVVDLWTDFHDTSGINITECGWRKDIVYNIDAAHPNSAGYDYWADKYWELFNEWTNNTFGASLTPNQTGDFYFRCYTNTDRPSLVSNMGSVYSTDAAGPLITLQSPSNDYSSTSTTVNFKFNVTDYSNVSYCSVLLDETEYSNTSEIDQTTVNTISVSSLGVGPHSWYVYCEDGLGNPTNSSSKNFTIEITNEVTQTFGSTSYSIEEESIEEGYYKSLYINWKVKFKINGESHQLNLDSFNFENQTATITLSSTPQTKVLSVGEEWKISFDGGISYVLLVRLNNVTYNRAEIFIMEINENGVIENPEEVQEEDIKDGIEIVKEESYFWRVMILILVIIGGIILYFYSRKGR